MILIVVVLIAVVSSSNKKVKPISNKDDHSSESSYTVEDIKPREYKSEAWVCAQFAIEDKLKSPSTAEFEPGGGTYSTTKLYDNTYKIDSYVDAQNSFGGMMRTRFSCIVEYNPNNGECSSSCSF